MTGALVLALGIVLTVVAGAALDWYPSRIGGPAYWLDDHLYQPVLGLLTPKSNWLALAGFAYTCGLVLSFLGYAVSARWALNQRSGRKRHLLVIVAVQAAISAWLMVQPYLSSQDIFSYSFYTHIFVWYHDNPYVAVPRDYPYDPLYSAIFWKDQPSNYGPLWTFLSALAPMIAGSRVGATLLILKGFAVAPALAGTLLMWSTLGRLRPERRTIGTLLYAWNPLLLIETAEAGHNDILMACFLIASLWLWCRRLRTASVGALIMAALVKYVAIMLLPIYLVAWWRGTGDHPLRILGRSAAVGLVLVIAAFAPIYAGPSTFAVVEFGSNSLAYTNSPGELAFRELRLVLGESIALTDLPMHYDGHWIGSLPSAILWTVPDEQRGTGVVLPTGSPLLVVEPEASSWVHVYEPRLGRFGFVRASLVHPIPVPQSSVVPGTTAAVLAGVSQDPVAQKANLFVRIGSLLIFFPWFCRSLWRVAREAHDRLTIARAATSLLVMYLLTVQSWFWPWYVIWVLPFAAIVPESGIAIVALAMTATTGLLNAQPSINPPPFLEWLYGSRVLLIYGLPIVVGWYWRSKMRYRAGEAEPAWRLASHRWGRRSPIGSVVGVMDAATSRLLQLTSAVKRTLRGCRVLVDDLVAPLRRGRSDNSRGERAETMEAHRGFDGGAQVPIAGFVTGAVLVLVAILVAVTGTTLEQRSAHAATVISWQRDFDEALRLYSAGDYEGAVDRLTAVLADVPRERVVLQLRIAANLQMARYAQTIPDLTTLLQNDPDNVELRFERGVMYARMQRSDKALDDFRLVMSAAPGDPSGFEWAGLVNFERGNLELASRQLAHALALDPRNGRIARELGNVLASDDRVTDALVLYDDAIQLDPTDARAYASRAALLRYLGSARSTIPDLRKVLVLSDDVQQQQWAVRLLGNLSGGENRPGGRTG